MKIARALALPAISLALVACGGGGGTETAAITEPANAPTTTAPAKYPAEVRKGFLEACGNRVDKKRCRCALDYLENNATVEEVAAAGLEASDKKTPKLIEKAVAKCAQPKEPDKAKEDE